MKHHNIVDAMSDFYIYTISYYLIQMQYLFDTVAAIVAVIFAGLAVCLIIICCGLVCLRR